MESAHTKRQEINLTFPANHLPAFSTTQNPTAARRAESKINMDLLTELIFGSE